MRYRCCNLIHNLITGFPPDPNPPDPLPLILTFNDINNNGVVADYNDLNEWNSVLIYPLEPSTTPFTSLEIIGNSVYLYGGVHVFMICPFQNNTAIIAVDDQAMCVDEFKGVGFSGSTIESVKMNGIIQIVEGWFSNTPISEVELNSCTIIKSGAFGFCTSLTTITDAQFSSVITIATTAFGFSSVTSISLSACTTIQDSAFQNCTALSSAIFPALITVGDGAFSSCSSLMTWSAPLLQTIGGTAFVGCAFTAFLGDNVTVIGSTAFQNCDGLTTLSFPALITMGDAVVQDCSNLTSFSAPLCIEMGLPPGGMADVGVFGYCTSLTTVYLPLCAQFGGSVGNDDTFNTISGQTIAITVPVSLQTCDAGAPDGDLVYLLVNNPLSTITYV